MFFRVYLRVCVYGRGRGVEHCSKACGLLLSLLAAAAAASAAEYLIARSRDEWLAKNLKH